MSRRQPRTFYTSDLHLGHEKVSAIRGFPNPFDHDLAIVEAWKETVGPEDTVYVLGDLAVGGWRRALDIVQELPGTKHLVAGNHDGVHPMNRSTYHSRMRDYRSAFASISPFLRRRIGGHEVLLSHFPYAEIGEGPYRGGAEASRHNQFRLPFMGLPIIHGHLHSPDKSIIAGTPGHPMLALHVGVDAWDLKPVPQETLVEMLDVWQGADFD